MFALTSALFLNAADPASSILVSATGVTFVKYIKKNIRVTWLGDHIVHSDSWPRIFSPWIPLTKSKSLGKDSWNVTRVQQGARCYMWKRSRQAHPAASPAWSPGAQELWGRWEQNANGFTLGTAPECELLQAECLRAGKDSSLSNCGVPVQSSPISGKPVFFFFSVCKNTLLHPDKPSSITKSRISSLESWVVAHAPPCPFLVPFPAIDKVPMATSHVPCLASPKKANRSL